MIYTVTLNPAVDYYISFSGFNNSGLNIAEKANYYAAGKGINVSKALSAVNIQSVALGFCGGFTGRFIIEEIDNDKNIDCRFTEINSITRINTKILDKNTETEITGVPPTVSEKEIEKLLSELKKVQKGDIVVFSGSIASGIPKNIYKRAAESLCSGVLTVLDVRGDIFLENVHSNFLCKPNQEEMYEIFADKDKGTVAEMTFSDALKYSKIIVERGISNVIVSMGGAGAVFTDGHDEFYLNAPKGKVISAVGAGDSMIAGFLYGIVSGKSKKECFRMSVAFGSATAFSDGIATKEKFYAVLKTV